MFLVRWLCSSGVLCCLCVFGVLGFCSVLWFVSTRFSCAVMFLGCLGCCVLVCSVVSSVLLVFAGFLCLLLVPASSTVFSSPSFFVVRVFCFRGVVCSSVFFSCLVLLWFLLIPSPCSCVLVFLPLFFGFSMP